MKKKITIRISMGFIITIMFLLRHGFHNPSQGWLVAILIGFLIDLVGMR